MQNIKRHYSKEELFTVTAYSREQADTKLDVMTGNKPGVRRYDDIKMRDGRVKVIATHYLD